MLKRMSQYENTFALTCTSFVHTVVANSGKNHQMLASMKPKVQNMVMHACQTHRIGHE